MLCHAGCKKVCGTSRAETRFLSASIPFRDDVLLFLQVYTGFWLRHYTPVRERVLSSQSEELGQVATSNATRRRRAGSAL
jgi:hypothetical protein